MSCFIAPLVQAIATSAYCGIKGRKNLKQAASPLKRALPALEMMLWGGTVMLIVDHIINGELTWRFPFFTVLAKEGGGLEVMWHEILSVGVPMCLVLTLIWAVWVYVRQARAKHVKA